MNKKNKIIILSIMVVVFFTLGLMVRESSEGILFDVAIMEYIHNNTNEGLVSIMKFISFIGSKDFIIPFTAMALSYFLIKKNYHGSKLLLLSTAGSWIVNFLLKQAFKRVRPLEYFLVDQGGYSFPSGHSMVTLTLVLTMAYLIRRRIGDENKRKLVNIISTIIIILMGASRVYLGVHWPTDVIGAYLIGYIFYYLSVTLINE